MAKHTTQGWYTFEDGYYVWFNGLNGTEKRYEIRLHGAIVNFEPTYL